MTPWASVLAAVVKVLGPLLAKLGIFMAGHRAGSMKAKLKSQERSAKLRKKADEIDSEIRDANLDDVRERLRRDANPD